MRWSVIFIGLTMLVARADAAGTGAPAYCINEQGDFYPYKEQENCKAGYQLGAGNCKLKDGHTVAVTKAECARMSGDVALPVPAARLRGEADPKLPSVPKPLTTQSPN